MQRSLALMLIALLMTSTALAGCLQSGEDGAVGADGSDGVTGPAGPAGADGADGVTGPAGPTGADGADGADGTDTSRCLAVDTSTHLAIDCGDHFTVFGADNSGLTWKLIGAYDSGLGEGASEISAYDADSYRSFVVNAVEGSIDILDLSEPTNPTLHTRVVIPNGEPNSVDCLLYTSDAADE